MGEMRGACIRFSVQELFKGLMGSEWQWDECVRVRASVSVNVCEFTRVRMCVHVSSARVCK